MKGLLKELTSREGPPSQVTKRSYGDTRKNGRGRTGEGSLVTMRKRTKIKRK